VRCLNKFEESDQFVLATFGMPDIYGRLQIQDGRNFEDSKPLSTMEQALELLAKVSKKSPKATPVDDWPRIIECVKRGTLMSLTAETVDSRIFLKFDTASPFFGNYELRVPAEHRYERGEVYNVTPIDEEGLLRFKYAMLSPFPFRYVVKTTASDRQGTQKFWLIGISSFVEAPIQS